MAQEGQVERLVRYYLPAYAERFPRIRLFSYADERLEDFTDDARVLDAVELVTLAHPRRHRALRAAGAAVGRERRRLRECALVRAFHTTGALPALLAGVPYVCTYGYSYLEMTGVPWRGPGRSGLLRAKRAAMTAALRTILSRARSVIATTAEVEAEARSLGARNVVRIPNGIDLSVFAEAQDGAAADFDLAFVGRFSPEKNLGALEAALERFPGARVAFVGDGPGRPGLEEALRARPVEATFFGVLPNPEVAGILRRSRAFVLPSLSEGQPKALLEAMAAGLPCVTMDVPPFAELVAAGAVEAASPPSAGALAAAIGRVLDDAPHAEVLAARGRTFAHERYDLRRTLAEETAFLAAAAQRSGPTSATTSVR